MNGTLDILVLYSPRSAYIRIFLIHNMLDVLAVFLDLVGHHDRRDSATNRENSKLPVVWIICSNIKNGRAAAKRSMDLLQVMFYKSISGSRA